MKFGGISKQKKATHVSGPPQISAGNSLSKQGELNTTHSGGCCRGLNDCMIMGSAVSTHQSSSKHNQYSQQSISKLVQQIADLEREVQNQKEHKLLYAKRTERTQEYLRYCLQIAQDNGFLHLIINDKDDQQQGILSSDVATSPLVPALVRQNSDLASIIDKAKLNGWYIDPLELELQEKLGHGSTADIYRGTLRGVDVAVKCIYPDYFHSNANGVSFFAQEVDTLSRQRHPYVLHLMGACLEPPNHGWVVTELLGMTLKDWLHGPGKRQKERMVPLPPIQERLSRALEISQAMQYLHEQKPRVIHRDLKPSNIFLDDSKHVRVADFGHARFLSDKEMALTGETGTLVYMAPEVIRCEPYDEKCDVYSFGIILNEIITGEYPYIETDYSPVQIAMEVGEGRLRPKLTKEDEQLGGLIDLICLSSDKDANNRPSFRTITCKLRNIRKGSIGETV